MTFDRLNLSRELNQSIKKMGFTVPTKIQEKSIPLILDGKDVLGESETGSGKTLAFGCGIVEKVVPNNTLQALILTPTRELAEQVKETLRKLSYHRKLKVISIYGGVSINPQIEQLKRAEVVVATPGRFRDHLGRNTVDTSAIKILVLDEADRMLDMGFIEDIMHIIRACPNREQTLFFSATLPPAIKKLAQQYQKSPVKIATQKFVDPSKLKQGYYDVPSSLKISLLIHLIKKDLSGRLMVFCNTRKSTDLVVKNLKLHNINAVALHGGYSQEKRTKAVGQFKVGKARVLVCTDVAARGIDIKNISTIYNYEIPNDPTDYVHRIGRTARAGKHGQVINLLSDNNHDNFSRVLQNYREFKIEKLRTPFIKRVKVQHTHPPHRVRKISYRSRSKW